MAENATDPGMHPVLEKLDKLTYGMIYPAFLGIMIYDVVQGVAENGVLRKANLYIAIMIVVFNLLDYMHLFVDMQKLVDKKFDGIKGRSYIISDLVGTCLFLVGFLLVKYGHDLWAMICIGLIPVTIAVYKENYYASEPDKRFSRRFATGSILLTIVGACVFSCNCMDNWFLVFFVTVEVIIYFLYIFFWFPKYNNDGASVHAVTTEIRDAENDTSESN